ncbi:MAG: hypothetical protein ACI8S6_001330 [Myxococcota bacterium]|jgi:hypothetical protein
MMKNVLLTALLAAGLVTTATASAASCIILDESRDSLSPGEQSSALLLLEDALSDAGMSIGEPPCEDPWEVSHARLGESITVILSTRTTRQRMTVARIEELPVAYERLIRAIQTGVSVTESADRNSVTSSEQSQNRIEAEPLIYAQLGAGVTSLDSPAVGTALGGGYRHELDRIAIDIGLFQMNIPNLEESDFAHISIVNLGVLYYLDPEANSSTYFGGGVGAGVGVSDNDAQFGAQVIGSVGYEMLRSTSIRIFPQLDLTAPIYTLEGSPGWLPTVRLTLGFAFTARPQSWGFSIL